MGNISRETEILRNIRVKNTVTEMKNASDGLTSGLDTAEEIISELEN